MTVQVCHQSMPATCQSKSARLQACNKVPEEEWLARAQLFSTAPKCPQPPALPDKVVAAQNLRAALLAEEERILAREEAILRKAQATSEPRVADEEWLARAELFSSSPDPSTPSSSRVPRRHVGEAEWVRRSEEYGQ